ncbi:MAG: hypothetical protein GY839_21950 [candidate division Zixibacteria bacterium]|nr:hypothetical protein [candidate division Zixibacteria bacterium]
MGNKRKILVYIVFACSVIYGGWFHFLGDDESKKPARSAVNRTADESVINEIVGQKTPREAGLTPVSIQTLSVPSGWGRNPFRDHRPSRTGATRSSEPKTTGKPHLTGISYHKDRASFAIINNKVIQANEKIDGWHVVSIYRDYVLIKKSGAIEKLTMGELF